MNASKPDQLTDDRTIQDVAVHLDALSAHLRDNGSQPMAQAVAEAARDMIPAAKWCSITLSHGAGFRSLVTTDEHASRIDHIQYDEGTGPCLDAITHDRVQITADLRSEDRWPGYSEKAVALGVRSVLAHPLHLLDDEGTVAGLNLYSDDVDGFADSHGPLSIVLATYAAIGVSMALSKTRAEQLEKALRTNREIAMAMGVIMGKHRVTRDDAFNLMRLASQSSNRRMSDIADEVITTLQLSLSG